MIDMKFQILSLLIAFQLTIKCDLIENYNDPALFIMQQMTQSIAYTRRMSSILRNYPIINCSQYANDDEIRRSFPFYVELDPKERNPSKTYALTNANKTKIIYLNIVDQEYFPPSAFCFQALKQLHIKNTSFVKFNHRLPPYIERLAPSLTHLVIEHTMIYYLSDKIGKLTGLETLKLVNVSLKSLPEAIGDLSSLSLLYLSHNKLILLPKTMKNFRLLNHIILTNNLYLRSVQPLNGLPALQFLQLDNCSIEHIPINLSNLTRLYMSNNNLTDLIGIQTLGDKTKTDNYYYFDNNHIQSIPSEIQNVKNLHTLDLSFNQLNSIPLHIFYISSLRYLRMENNLFVGCESKEVVMGTALWIYI
jgi:Leucine-rich repeat (LRR) protein